MVKPRTVHLALIKMRATDLEAQRAGVWPCRRPAVQTPKGCTRVARGVFQTHPFSGSIEIAFVLLGKSGAPGGTRTPDLLVRSQTLYPTELRAHCETNIVA